MNWISTQISLRFKGFYTSRPALKGYIRSRGAFLRNAGICMNSVRSFHGYSVCISVCFLWSQRYV